MRHVGHLHWLFPICPTLGLEQAHYSARIAGGGHSDVFSIKGRGDIPELLAVLSPIHRKLRGDIATLFRDHMSRVTERVKGKIG